MNPYIIAYDLKEPGQKCDQLRAVIDSSSNFQNIWIEESVCLVKTDKTPEELKKAMGRYLDSNDLVFISEISSNFASTFDDKLVDKIKKLFN